MASGSHLCIVVGRNWIAGGSGRTLLDGSGMAKIGEMNLLPADLIFRGLACGVDTPGHRGAIAAKGKTVAVFGTGVDVIDPKENSRRVDQISFTGGAVVSEFPLKTFAAPQNFPIRNRIISGISIGVLVVEAAEYSGTRITSRCALGAESRGVCRAREPHQ